jgi:uncharacterized protein YbgA (DUF1722 family)
MKNNEEKFFFYLKDKMSSQDKLIFKDELKKSEKLNSEFEEYKNLVHFINETKNVEINKEYLESIVPDFRGRLEKINQKKSSINLKYVFASILIIIGGYFIVSQIDSENKQELKQVLTDLSDDELNLIATDFYSTDELTKNLDDISTQKIDSIYSENLKNSLAESIDDINSNVILSKNNVTDVDRYLSDNDIDLIYSQLIEKKIL